LELIKQPRREVIYVGNSYQTHLQAWMFTVSATMLPLSSRHVLVCDLEISFRAGSWVHKYTWTSPDGKTHNQIDHILKDLRWHSAIVDIRSIRGVDCDTDHYLVVAKVRERLAVSKQTVQNVNVERFNHRKLNELKVRKQCQIKVSKRFVALENLSEART